MRVFVVAAIGAIWLAGCAQTQLPKQGSGLDAALAAIEPKADTAKPEDAKADATDTTGTVPAEDGESTSDTPTAPGLLGSKSYDDLNLAKKQFRENNYGLAEKYFRKATESHPTDAEAWLGLGASYDRLRRFDLADRAYRQAVKIVGPRPEILNNHGYSYMLRGDYKNARKLLLAAQAKDPNNPYVKNNLRLLSESYHQGKAIE